MKDDRLYLIHIRECIAKIDEYVGSGGKEGYMKTPMVQDAVLRNLQVLAESTQQVSETKKESYPKIEWRKIAGFRNVLVHDYLGVDLERVWNIIENDLPQLKRAIEKMIEEMG